MLLYFKVFFLGLLLGGSCGIEAACSFVYEVRAPDAYRLSFCRMRLVLPVVTSRYSQPQSELFYSRPAEQALPRLKRQPSLVKQDLVTQGREP